MDRICDCDRTSNRYLRTLSIWHSQDTTTPTRGKTGREEERRGEKFLFFRLFVVVVGEEELEEWKDRAREDKNGKNTLSFCVWFLFVCSYFEGSKCYFLSSLFFSCSFLILFCKESFL